MATGDDPDTTQGSRPGDEPGTGEAGADGPDGGPDRGSHGDGGHGFAELVASEHRGLIAAAVMIIGDRARAEEIVQDAFVRAYERWNEVGDMDRPGAWVRRVVINGAISATRRRGTEHRALRRLMSRRGDRQQPAVDLTDRAIWRVVGSLPGNQATAVALHYGSDLSIPTVAEEMELSAPAVRTLLYRARTALRSDPEVLRLVGDAESVAGSRPDNLRPGRGDRSSVTRPSATSIDLSEEENP